MRTTDRIAWTLGMVFVFSGWALGEGLNATNVVTLSRHETVAEFIDTRYHRCLGMTSLCPDQCGESGTVASFKIAEYLNYQKSGEYGDPKSDTFVFMIEDNMKRLKVTPAIRDTMKSLKKGDRVFLSWNHNYVTVDGSSWPERPITKLERIPSAEIK